MNYKFEQYAGELKYNNRSYRLITRFLEFKSNNDTAEIENRVMSQMINGFSKQSSISYYFIY